MIEILQYVTSGFWVFIGCTMFSSSILMCSGWALNAVFIGLRGEKCSDLEILS